jgi:hypothetical protein
MRARVGETADTRIVQRPDKSGPHALAGRGIIAISYIVYT